MKRLVNAVYGIAVILIFGTALCADSIMDTYGPAGFIVRAGLCIGAAGALVFAANYIERRMRERGNRYTGRPFRKMDRRHERRAR